MTKVRRAKRKTSSTPRPSTAAADPKDEIAMLRHELTEAHRQQTTLADVLEVISSSPGAVEPVFETMLANAARPCDAKFGTLSLYDGSAFQNVALHNTPPGFIAHRGTLFRPHPESGLARVARTKQVVQIADIRTEPPYREGDPAAAAIVNIAA